MRTIAFLLVGFMGPALAQAPQVPTSVTEVHTGGWWQADGKSGTYRVIVVNQGWEHISSKVFVEWVSEPSDRESTQEVVSSLELGTFSPIGPAVMNASLRRGKTGGVVIGVEATPNTSSKANAKRFTFCAREPETVATCTPEQ